MNMSYCRFRNTRNDLRDCINALSERNISSDEEKRAAKEIINMMLDFLNDEDLLDDEGNLNEETLDNIIEQCDEEY